MKKLMLLAILAVGAFVVLTIARKTKADSSAYEQYLSPEAKQYIPDGDKAPSGSDIADQYISTEARQYAPKNKDNSNNKSKKDQAPDAWLKDNAPDAWLKKKKPDSWLDKAPAWMRGEEVD